MVKGNCLDMCPVSERIQRDKDNQLHRVELFAATKQEKLPIKGNQMYTEFLRKFMIKRYQRSSADHSLQVMSHFFKSFLFLNFISLHRFPI